MHGLPWSAALLMSGARYLERRAPRLLPGRFRVSLTSDARTAVPHP
ncbi:hypothetical protein [Streptomyces jumonjinensis]